MGEKRPAEQMAHADEDIMEYFPLGQFEQIEDPVVAKVPASQTLHEAAEAELNLPASQELQDLKQVSKLEHVALYLPDTQLEHVDAPALLSDPAAQIEHDPDPLAVAGWYLPAVQLVQVVTPIEGLENFPAPQAEQLVAAFDEVFPSAQKLQVVDPDASLNFPTVHSLQDEASTNE
jgi:hypothetical protein